MTFKKRGDNKVQCDRTGAIVHASDCRLTWDRLFVLKQFWYPRQPQDTNFPIKEGMPPAIVRPVGDPVFIGDRQDVQSTWSDRSGIEWSDGTNVEWSENEVAETDG